jgi:SPP1 family predicted phage head-tail adaptor
MVFDKPITIQRINENTEEWEDAFSLHARVNKSSGSEYLNAGADQSKSTRVFEVRYFKGIEDIDDSRGLYRLLYRGRKYNITDYDDYLEEHKTVKLLGVSYG